MLPQPSPSYPSIRQPSTVHSSIPSLPSLLQASQPRPTLAYPSLRQPAPSLPQDP